MRAMKMSKIEEAVVQCLEISISDPRSQLQSIVVDDLAIINNIFNEFGISTVVVDQISSSADALFQEDTVMDVISRELEAVLVPVIEKSIQVAVDQLAESIIAEKIEEGWQALGAAMSSLFESSCTLALQRALTAMLQQVESCFKNGIEEYTRAFQQQIIKQMVSKQTEIDQLLMETNHSVSLMASSLCEALRNQININQRNVVALELDQVEAAMLNLKESSFCREKVEAPMDPTTELLRGNAAMDPTTELLRLISEEKYQESFTLALEKRDVSLVSWLCSEVDLDGLLKMNPLPLSKQVLQSLLQQLASDSSKDKPAWIKGVSEAIETRFL